MQMRAFAAAIDSLLLYVVLALSNLHGKNYFAYATLQPVEVEISCEMCNIDT